MTGGQTISIEKPDYDQEILEHLKQLDKQTNPNSEQYDVIVVNSNPKNRYLIWSNNADNVSDFKFEVLIYDVTPKEMIQQLRKYLRLRQ